MEAICTINTMNPPGIVPSSRFSRRASSVCSDVSPPVQVSSGPTMSGVSASLDEAHGYFPNPFAARQRARLGRTVAANTVASIPSAEPRTEAPAANDPPGYFPAPRARANKAARQGVVSVSAVSATVSSTIDPPGYFAAPRRARAPKQANVAVSAVSGSTSSMDPPGYFPAPRARTTRVRGATVAPNTVASQLPQDPPGYFPAPKRRVVTQQRVSANPVAAVLTTPKSAVASCDPPGYFLAPRLAAKSTPVDPPGYFPAPSRRRPARRGQLSSNEVAAVSSVDMPGYFPAPRLAKQLRSSL